MSATIPLHVRRIPFHSRAVAVGAGLVLLAGAGTALVVARDDASTKQAPAPIVSAPSAATPRDPLVNRYMRPATVEPQSVKRF
jgi:hypothetical protein